MKSTKIITILALACIFLISCEAIQKATNSTGSAFSLTGQWQLNSNSPDNSSIGTKITVAPFVSEGRISGLVGSSYCFRENDVLWKDIAANNVGGFTINNLVNGCNGLIYNPAVISVVNNDEIRVTGKNANANDMQQVWKRIK
jgi:hypothetical protein